LAFNPNGTVRWQFNTGRVAEEDGGECGTILIGEQWGLPAMGADGTIYIGAMLGTSGFTPASRPMLYAINTSGTTNWHLSLHGMLIESPAIGADGTVYVKTHSRSTNRLEAISSTGIRQWDAPIPGFSAHSPALISDGTILMGSTAGLVTMSMNGTNQNVLNVPGQIWAPVIAPGGRVYVSSYQGTLYALRGTADAAKTPWPMHRRDVMQSGRAPSIATNQPALVSVRQRGGSLLEMRYTGEVARDYQIEASSNLLDWEAVSAFASVEPVVPFRDPGADGSRGRFYRLRSP
jgi:outer membrane protein assembly factor BamB